MAIAMKLGGYSAAQADELRRTMGHIRKVEKLHRVLEQLRARMVERGVEEDVAVKIAEDLKSFANYGFPESHAWSFALIAYATGYLKAHYTAEFYAGLLNSYPMGFYPPSTLIHDARRHGLKVLPPCMRDGDWECTTEPTENPDRPALRIGWRHIRGLGEKTLEALKTARGWGRFSSIDDVIERSKLQRTDALQLARAGAFGCWEPDRRRAAWVAMRSVGDTLPLAPARETSYDPRPLTRDELIFLDYFSVGISVSGHPMEHLREKLRHAGVLDSRQLEKLKGGEWITTAGLVTIRQQPQSAKGTVFLLMEDEHGGDEKLICVPVDTTFPYYSDVGERQDLPSIVLQQIEHFFTHYKDLEVDKWVRVGKWGDAADARRILIEAIDRARTKVAAHA